MVFKDYYMILELDSSKASFNEIKDAYRNQAKKYHPDRNRKFSEERIKDINEAYKILSNPITKRKYDRKWKSNIQREKKENKTYEINKETKTFKQELIDMFFGGSVVFDKKQADKSLKKEKKNKIKENKKALKGENIKTEIDITLKEGFLGKEKTLKLRNIDGNIENIKVKIPRGIKNDDNIRFVGFGKKGIHGGKNGDLFVKIKINDEDNLKLEENDLKTNLEIYPWEAVLGTTKIVYGIDESLKIKVPAGTSTGKTFKIQDKGYIDSFGKRGNLYVNINIKIDENISEKEKELYEQMKALNNENK